MNNVLGVPHLGALQAQVEFHGRTVRHRDEAGDARSAHAEFAPRERERTDGLKRRSGQTQFDRKRPGVGGSVMLNAPVTGVLMTCPATALAGSVTGLERTNVAVG